MYYFLLPQTLEVGLGAMVKHTPHTESASWRSPQLLNRCHAGSSFSTLVCSGRTGIGCISEGCAPFQYININLPISCGSHMQGSTPP